MPPSPPPLRNFNFDKPRLSKNALAQPLERNGIHGLQDRNELVLPRWYGFRRFRYRITRLAVSCSFRLKLFGDIACNPPAVNSGGASAFRRERPDAALRILL